MNILISSVGKRVTLVKIFQKELKAVYPQAKVYTTELNPSMSPAAIISDGCFKVSPVSSEKYLGELLDMCLKNDIGLVIPTIDTELEFLAVHKDYLMQYQIEVSIPELKFIQLCRDKRKTNSFFKEKGIRIPKIVDKNNPVFPLFAKPYDGSLSKDIYLIHNSTELTPNILHHPKLMFMEYIDKAEYKEYTVDMYYGRDNHVKLIVPRERIEVRAGEINKGITRKNILVHFLKDRLGYLPGVVGCICIQLFIRNDERDIIGIEINPRFGGGYPLSYYAKANFPAFVIKEYFERKPVEYSEDWLDNTLMLRYDSEIIVYSEP